MKRLYSFGKKKTDGDSDMLESLGGKGAHLAGMSKLGMNVPFGFTIPTDYCVDFNKIVGKSFASRNKKKEIISKLSERSVKRLDYLKTTYKIKANHVCLFSVRSGARVSMPGMMDTILNVGITSENFPTLEKQLGKQCANDCLSRLIKMYGEIVKKVNKEKFVTLEDKFAESTANNEIYSKETGEAFPDSLQDQLSGAIKAVFESWNNPRAIQYREHHGYSHDWGTAVTVQRMVFGNLNEKSCSGVYFTRDPSSGENILTGEFLPNAQGEDVVAGVVTPFPITDNLTFYKELKDIGLKLETHYKNVQDIEFTIEDGEVYLLQTRTAKQSPIAAFKITNDFVKEGLIDLQTAKVRLTGELFERTYLPTIKNKSKSDSVGLGASNGIVCGGCFRNIDEYNAIKKTGSKAIFTAVETTPDDLDLMMKADAVLTKIGGFTSHAAVVCRGLDKPCVTGVSDLDLPVDQITTIDGSTGEVWYKALEIEEADFNSDAVELLEKLGGSLNNSKYKFIDVCNLPDVDTVDSNVVLITNQFWQENMLFNKLTGNLDNCSYVLSEVISFVESIKAKGKKVFDATGHELIDLKADRIEYFKDFTQLFDHKHLLIDKPLASILSVHYESVLEALNQSKKVELAELIPYPADMFKQAYELLG